MSQYTYTTLENCNFHASWVVNIRGEGEVDFRGDSFPALPGGLVYNILGSGRVIDVKDTAVSGSILAPLNILHQTGGYILGKVVAADVTFALQINKHNDCPNPGTITIPVPTTTDTPAGTDVVPVSVPVFGTGDNITIPGVPDTFVVVGSWGGDVASIVVDHPVPSNIPAGTIISTSVDGTKGRPDLEKATPTNPPNSASSISVAFALIVALFALI